MNNVTRLPHSAPGDGFWPGEGVVFSRDTLDSLFEWAFRLGASDIRIETHKPVFVQLHGRMRQVTRRTFTEREVEERSTACTAPRAWPASSGARTST